MNDKWKLPLTHYIGQVRQQKIKNGQSILETEGENQYLAVVCPYCNGVRLAANMEEKMIMEEADCDCRFKSTR